MSKSIKMGTSIDVEYLKTNYNIAHTCPDCDELLKPINKKAFECKNCFNIHNTVNCCDWMFDESSLQSKPNGTYTIQYSEAGFKRRTEQIKDGRIEIPSHTDYLNSYAYTSSRPVMSFYTTYTDSSTNPNNKPKERVMYDDVSVSIYTRSIETVDGWVGQVVVNSKVVWQGNPIAEGNDDLTAEHLAFNDAVKSVQDVFRG